MPSPDTEIDLEPRPPSRRKSTKRWCKGHVGREHQPVIVLDTRRIEGCGPWKFRVRNITMDGWDTFTKWRCCHITRCAVCEKILDDWPPACPDKPDDMEQSPY